MIRLPPIPPDRPVLIAGATASGKSALALRIAREAGGVIVNADASQVYGCWRVVTARPSPEDEAAAPHRLYGHVAWDAPYSAGHWLRQVAPLLRGGVRPIIVGGTGLYFSALTQGLAEIPDVPAKVRAEADALPIEAMLADPPQVIFSAGDPRSNEDRMLSHPALEALDQTSRERFDRSLLWCGGPTIIRAAERLNAVRNSL